METAFDTLHYESDISECSTSVKSEISAKSNDKLNTHPNGGQKRSRARMSTGPAQKQPIRRSLRKSTVSKDNKDANDNDESMKKTMNGKISNAKDKKSRAMTDQKEVRILGATEVNDELHFLFTEKDQETPHLIANDEAKQQFPHALMDFYESCMVWDVSEKEVEDINGALEN